MFLSGRVGFTFTQYYKLEGNGETLEGVIARDFNNRIFGEVVKDEELEYDNFFCASVVSQNILIATVDG